MARGKEGSDMNGSEAVALILLTVVVVFGIGCLIAGITADMAKA